jgi:hypothetical protein
MVQHIEFTSGVRKDWGQKPVAIVGGGPSLRGFDFNRLRDRFTVLAINGSMFDIPFADAGFSLDLKAIRLWWPRLVGLGYEQFYAVDRRWISGINSKPTPKMRFLLRRQGPDLSTADGIITAGGTSGFGALNLAFLRGAKKIVLLGFDYGGAGGVWHHNEHHYTFQQQQDRDNWAKWATNFNRPAQFLRKTGVEVINASPDSAITAFPRSTIDEVIPK